MNCPECGEDTFVYDTRQTRTNVVRRRRQCSSCGHRFTTRETTVNATRLIEQRRAALRALRARLTPEQRKARVQRDHLRRAAREESRRTGEDVKTIYARWGCE